VSTPVSRRLRERTSCPSRTLGLSWRWQARLGAFRGLLERDALPIVVVAMWAAALVAVMPLLLVQDSWLSFVDGRLIARSWLPHADTLTLWTLGRHWVDQQWAAHLLLYELVQRGGLAAAAGFGVACVVGTLVVVAVSARRLGASPRSTALALMLPVLAAPWLVQLRSQSLALIPFVLVYGLLAFDARKPGRRVLWVLPILAVWANLHGSAALGAGIVLVYGLSLVRSRGRARGLLLVVAAPLCLLASPYGLALVPYYRLMLLHPPLASVVSEWKPPAVSAVTAIFFASAFGLAVLWGAHRRVLTSFERWALPLLLVFALSAVRNTIWFELAAAVALPRLIDAAWHPNSELTPALRRANLLLASTALGAVLLVSVVEFSRSPAWFDRDSPPEAAAAVAASGGTSGIVVADDEHADWLLWLQPSLIGRVAYDVRFELFDSRELQEIELIHHGSHPIWRRCVSQARVVTFDGPNDEEAARREQLLAHGSRTIFNSPGFIAVLQPTAPSSTAHCTL
jgi:hypothetical protein